MYICQNELKIINNLDKLFLLLKYGAPLIFSGVGMIIINSSDKYFLKMSYSLDVIGVYAVGYTIGSSINIFIASFQAAWPQMMFSVSDKPNSDIIYGKVLTYYVYFIGMIWIILSSFSYEIIFFMTDHKFIDSYSVIPIVSLAYAF